MTNERRLDLPSSWRMSVQDNSMTRALLPNTEISF